MEGVGAGRVDGGRSAFDEWISAGKRRTGSARERAGEGWFRAIEAQADGPFEYTTYRPSDSLYVLDLSGVSAADPAGARVVASNLVKSYRVITYAAGEKPVVRVEILLQQGVEPRLDRKDNQELALVVSRSASVDSKSTAPAPALVPAAAKSSDIRTASAGYEAIRQVHLSGCGERPRSISQAPARSSTMQCTSPARIGWSWISPGRI